MGPDLIKWLHIVIAGILEVFRLAVVQVVIQRGL